MNKTVQAPTARTDQRRRREFHILETAEKIIMRKGLLALKMSTLAQEAGVSTGTLYTHFESKEDLFVAITIDSWRRRCDAYEEAFAVPGSYVEKLIAAHVVHFLFTLVYTELVGVEQLVAAPSVQQCASPGRRQEALALSEHIAARITSIAREAIRAGQLDGAQDPDRQAAAIERGIWGLNVGMSYIWHVEDKRLLEANASVTIPPALAKNIISLFRGYGWKTRTPERDFQRVVKHCVAIIDRDASAPYAPSGEG